MNNSALLELLYKAKHAEVGIIVTTSSPESLRQKLYAARKVDPDLKALSFVTSPTNPHGELWIVRKK